MREPEGFREYVTARQAALGRAAYLLVGDRHMAEDLVQISLTKAWRHWERVSRAENVDAYIHRILMNTFTSAWRRRWRGELPVERMPEGAAHDPYPGWDDRDLLLAAVRRLPPRQRAVVVLRYYLDRSEAETAEALGCSVGTVKSQNSKALRHLREQMEVAVPSADGLSEGIA